MFVFLVNAWQAKPTSDESGAPYRTVDNAELTATLSPDCATLDELFAR